MTGERCRPSIHSMPLDTLRVARCCGPMRSSPMCRPPESVQVKRRRLRSSVRLAVNGGSVGHVISQRPAAARGLT